MPIIAFVHTKGGVGKTTGSIHVASDLHSRGYKTLLVDCDHTTRSTSSFAAVAANARQDALSITSAAHVSYVARLSNDYDWTVVDSRPATIAKTGELDDDLFLETLWVADFLAVSVLPSPTDVWNMTRPGGFLTLLRRALKLKPTLRAGVFLNMADDGLEAREAAGMLSDWNLPVLPSLRRLTDFKRSLRFGQGLAQWKPESAAAKQVHALTGEIVRHVQEVSASTDDRPSCTSRSGSGGLPICDADGLAAAG